MCVHRHDHVFIATNVRSSSRTPVRRDECAFIVTITCSSRRTCVHLRELLFIMANARSSWRTRVHRGEHVFIVTNPFRSKTFVNQSVDVLMQQNATLVWRTAYR